MLLDKKLAVGVLCGLVLLLSSTSTSLAAQTRESSAGGQDQALAPFRETHHWIMNILREFFVDIDWDTITKAQAQIEKVVHKVDRLWRSFRSQSGSAKMETERSILSRWWMGSSKKSDYTKTDSTDVKAMLERVACFVGYLRILNQSQEALAEIDASKVISNLFSGSKNSSGYFSNLFGG